MEKFIQEAKCRIYFMPFPKEHIFTKEDYWNLPEGQRGELIVNLNADDKN